MTQQKNLSILVFIDSNVEDYQSLISGVSPKGKVIILDETRDGIEQITQRLAIEKNIEAIHIISHGSPGVVQLGANTLNSSNIESFGHQLKQWRKALTNGADILLYGCNIAADVSVKIDSPDISHIPHTHHIRQGLKPLSHSLSRLKPTENNQDNLFIQSSSENFRYQTGVLAFDGTGVKSTGVKPTKPNHFLQRLSELTGADIAASANPTGNAKLGGDWELEVQIGSIEATPIQALAYSHTLAATANPDSKAITVNSPQVSISIDVLANDTGSSRVSVNSITTAPTNGTAIINDWIYAGGNFTTIGGQARNRIARLNSDGSVDATFNPNANSTVRAIALDSSGNPIVVGEFINIGGQPRSGIAKLNPTTGAADATFDPNANSTVRAIALDSSGNPIVVGEFI
ncbi:DUF4347 domain-containing protein, partial [Microcoleus sp. Pol17_C1]